MPEVLRIERESTGELASVPFLWTAGPRIGGGRTIDSLAKVAPVYLSLLRGSRQISPLGEGRIQETFTVLGKKGNTNTQAEVARLMQMFKIAFTLEDTNDMSDTIFFVEQAQDELAARRAVVYSGYIAPLDDAVIDRSMSTDHALFAVTVERGELGEYGDVVSSSKLGTVVDNHGGTWILPDIYTSNGDVSRVSNLVVRTAQSGFFKKFWLGIKPNRTGFTSFDSDIAVGTGGTVVILSGDTRTISDSDGALGGSKVVIDYSKTSDWKVRFRCPITQWNSTTSSGESVRNHYLGTYHLLGRYRISGDASASIGYRLGTGWEETPTITWSNRNFLRPSLNNWGEAQWQYKNFGTISIGGGMWGIEVKDRLVLEGFNIFAESMKNDGGAKTMFEIDNMKIVPADHYIFVDLDAEIKPNRRVEVFTNNKGIISAYVVESVSGDAAGKPLALARKVYGEASNLTHENWGVPWEAGSALVIVGDRDEENTKAPVSYFRIDLASKMRTAAYSYGT